MQTPSGGITTTAYDAVGNTTAVTDPLNHKTTSVYDALNRLTASVDALNGTTTYAYDAANNRTVLTDPSGNRTTFAYDALNRETQETDPLNHSATFAYDAAGRMTSATDRLGRRLDFAFDGVGRKTAVTWLNEEGYVANPQTFTYDVVGNQLGARDLTGAYTMAYDVLDRMTSVQEPFGQVLTYSYDGVGNRTQVQDSLGGVTTSVYDAANQLTSRKLSSAEGNLRIDWTYTARGQQETELRYSDLAATTKVGETNNTYDAAGRVQNIQHKNGAGSLLANYTYTFDLADRVTTEVTNGTTKTYSYDATDQVTHDSTATYTYDANGNRTMSGYTTGTGNQMTNDGTWTYTYDLEGSNTKKSKGALLETWVYSYDNLNRLIEAEQSLTDGGTVIQRVSYIYDVFGNRIQRAVTIGATVTERYAYLDQNVWADLDGSNAIKARYLFGDQIDEIYARVTAATTTVAYYLTDRLGSVRGLTSGSGVLIDEISYDAYGNATETVPALGDRYKFTAREWDDAVKAQYNRARWLRPDTGGWMSRDPIGFAAGDGNLYRYVRNKPTIFLDPMGLASIPSTFPYGMIGGPQVSADKVGVGAGFFGAFAYGIKWKLTTPTGAAAKSSEGGWIYQHIRTTFNVKPAHPADDNQWDYWEAWYVPKGASAPKVNYKANAKALGPMWTFGQKLKSASPLLGSVGIYTTDQKTGAFKPGSFLAKLIGFNNKLFNIFNTSHDIYSLVGAPLTSGSVSFAGEAYYVDCPTIKPFFRVGGALHAGGLRSTLTAGNEGNLALWFAESQPLFSNKYDHTLFAKWSSGGIAAPPPADPDTMPAKLTGGNRSPRCDQFRAGLP